MDLRRDVRCISTLTRIKPDHLFLQEMDAVEETEVDRIRTATETYKKKGFFYMFIPARPCLLSCRKWTFRTCRLDLVYLNSQENGF